MKSHTYQLTATNQEDINNLKQSLNDVNNLKSNMQILPTKHAACFTGSALYYFSIMICSLFSSVLVRTSAHVQVALPEVWMRHSSSREQHWTATWQSTSLSNHVQPNIWTWRQSTMIKCNFIHKSMQCFLYLLGHHYLCNRVACNVYCI